MRPSASGCTPAAVGTSSRSGTPAEALATDNDRSFPQREDSDSSCPGPGLALRSRHPPDQQPGPTGCYARSTLFDRDRRKEMGIGQQVQSDAGDDDADWPRCHTYYRSPKNLVEGIEATHDGNPQAAGHRIARCQRAEENGHLQRQIDGVANVIGSIADR